MTDRNDNPGGFDRPDRSSNRDLNEEDRERNEGGSSGINPGRDESGYGGSNRDVGTGRSKSDITGDDINRSNR